MPARFSCVIAAIFVVASLCGVACAQDGGELRVATYNIHHGEGTDGRVDLDRVADVLRGNDIVALNEVDRHNIRTGFADQPSRIASRLGLKYRVFGETRRWLLFMQYGNAILSRFPIVSSKNHDLPRLETLSERRRMLQADILVRGQVVHVFSTHLSLKPAERAKQVERIVEILRRTPGRKILLGDFNALPGSAEIRNAAGALPDVWAAKGSGAGFTFSSLAPKRRIDYVFASAIGLAPVAARVVDTELASGAHPSDHRPISVTLRVE